MPEGDKPLPLEEAQMGFEFLSPDFIFVGIGTKDLHRCQCLGHP